MDAEESLLEEIEQEMRNMHTTTIKLWNNQPMIESRDPIEQCLIQNFGYLSRLFEKEFDGENYGNELHDMETLKENIQEELDFLTSDITQLMQKINENVQTMSSIETNISNLNSMMETGSREAFSNKNLSNIMKHIKMRFKKEKSDLKTITTTLFADNLDIQDLIAKIIEHHFNEGSDKYLQLEKEDNILEQIETLRRTNLFEVNPDDVLQIRLADLI